MNRRSAAFLAALLITIAPSPLVAQTGHPKYGTWGVATADMDKSVRPGDDFYRYADGRLRDAFPTLPTARSSTGSCATTWSYRGFRFALDGGHGSQRRPYEALDSSATSVREAKRRGEGWLTGCADIGWSNRLGGTKVFACSSRSTQWGW